MSDQQAQVEPNRVDKMLLKAFDELLEQEPHRAEGPVFVIGETTGALSTELARRQIPNSIIQDRASIAQDLRTVVSAEVRSTLDQDLLAAASTVLVYLPRPLEALEEISWNVAHSGSADVVMIGAGAEKHLSKSMNTVLEKDFEKVHATRGAFKARALVARSPRETTRAQAAPPRIPRRNTVSFRDQELHLRAFGLTFGAARLDAGTRLLCETLLEQNLLEGAESVVDLGSGNGTVVTVLAQHTQIPHLIATDDSAAAVASTQHTLKANGFDAGADRFTIMHQNGLKQLQDNSVDAVVLNPPFHDEHQVTRRIAHGLLRDSARVLKPGGKLLVVANAGLNYRPVLTSEVGPTDQVARNKTFVVTVSKKGS